MSIESAEEFLLKGFEVDKGILFRVIDKSALAPETARNHASTFNPGIYYGIVRAIQRANDSADILSAEIHDMDKVDVDKGDISGCFRNMTMNEGDENLLILQIVDRRPARSHIYVPPTET